MTQRLTLLQRAVIQRLRDAGYHAYADCAHDNWRHGEPCGLPVLIVEAELRADYERANSQAAAT